MNKKNAIKAAAQGLWVCYTLFTFVLILVYSLKNSGQIYLSNHLSQDLDCFCRFEATIAPLVVLDLGCKAFLVTPFAGLSADDDTSKDACMNRSTLF